MLASLNSPQPLKSLTDYAEHLFAGLPSFLIGDFMSLRQHHGHSRLPALIRVWRALAPVIVMLVAGLAESAAAEPAQSRTTVGGSPQLPRLTEKPRRPAAELEAVYDGVQGNDAMFEVVLGQSRLFTCRKDILGDKAEPVLAVGNPAVADVEIVPHSRLLRVYGLRPGVTDISVTSGAGEAFGLEVHVIYDLPLLHARLGEVFPVAEIKLRQVRDHVIVEGQAQSRQQAKQIIQVIEGFLESEQTEIKLAGPKSAVPPTGERTPGAGQATRRPEVNAVRPKPRVFNLLRVDSFRDLDVLELQLKRLFPDALVKLSTVRNNVVVEGEARDARQVDEILRVIEQFVRGQKQIAAKSTLAQLATTGMKLRGDSVPRPGQGLTGTSPPAGTSGPVPEAVFVADEEPTASGTGEAQVINLLRVPGPQQVMLKVKIAELNRTALRGIGTDLMFSRSGTILGTELHAAHDLQDAKTSIVADANSLLATITAGASNQTTAFGVFESMGLEVFLYALRRNDLLKILAEPNLVALNGQQASFLAGGQIPIPEPSGLGTVSVVYKDYGVKLNFTPFVQQNGVIRLVVSPEVSNRDDAAGIQIAPDLPAIPAISVRKAETTVELRDGQTLMLAGLLEVQATGHTSQIPGLANLPILGSLFKSASHQIEEKELVVMVTPHIVEGTSPDGLPPLPGDQLDEPTDLELFLYRRMEGATGKAHRSTAHQNSPPSCRCVAPEANLRDYLHLEGQYVQGPHGFLEP